MRRLSTVGLAAALSLGWGLGWSGAAAARTPLFWGAGAKPCREWTAARFRQDPGTAAMRGWVFGMVSGYNMRRDPREVGVTAGGDVLDNASPAELLGGVDAYCDANPDDPIWGAVFAILQELDKRNAALNPPPPVAADAAATGDAPPPADAPAPPPSDAPTATPNPN